jgi:hypothetical protein
MSSSRSGRLLLYTIGTTEGRDRAGKYFELTSAASTLGTGTLDEALDRRISALTTHVGHDLTPVGRNVR